MEGMQSLVLVLILIREVRLLLLYARITVIPDLVERAALLGT